MSPTKSLGESEKNAQIIHAMRNHGTSEKNKHILSAMKTSRDVGNEQTHLKRNEKPSGRRKRTKRILSLNEIFGTSERAGRARLIPPKLRQKPITTLNLAVPPKKELR